MKQTDIASETWLELSQAAEYLGVHFTTLRRWADSGEVAFMRTPGGRRRFSLKALDAFLLRQSQGSAQTTALAKADSTIVDEEPTGPMGVRALDHARQSAREMKTHGSWMARLNEEQRTVLRGTGRTLMALLLQYNGRTEGGDVFLEEGKRIARLYSLICSQVGLNLQETVGVFLHFRRAVLDSVLETRMLERSEDQEEGSRLYNRTTDFMDGMLLDLIGSYPSAPTLPNTPHRKEP